jgi:hypothetical protein
MGSDQPKDEWPRIGANGAAPDTSLEEAAFEREHDRLVRDHPGKIAVVRFDEVVGVFDTLEAATQEAHRRFGWGRMLFCLITPRDGPEYIPNVDIHHPSFKRLG